MRILFTDDQIDTCKLYEMAFQIYGHSVLTVRDAPSAIEAARVEQFDIMIIDIDMPGMSGWEAIREIRKLPNGRDVPIVVYTSYYTQRDLDKAYAVGANDLFTKPMMPEEVNRRMEGICAAFRNAPGKAAAQPVAGMAREIDKAAWLERLIER